MIDVFDMTLSIEFSWKKTFVFWIKILLDFVPKRPIYKFNDSVLVQIMAWCQTIDQPLPEEVMTISLTRNYVTMPKGINLRKGMVI